MSIGKLLGLYVLVAPFLWNVLDKGILQGVVVFMWMMSLAAIVMICSDFVTEWVVKDLKDKWDD